MKIITWEANEEENREPGVVVRVSKNEAIQLINSLTNQLLANSANSGRLETTTVDGQYFSIAVNVGLKDENN